MNIKGRAAIERYGMLRCGDKVIVALSGGADSCAMLHFLHSLREEYALELIAVHVNHMIRGQEAERDAVFAEEFCRVLDVTFHLYRRDVPQLAAERGIGLEECGRAVRYEILEQEAEKCCGKIATAHTRSDSVETVLFHIIRGCSVAGLQGIPPVRGNVIRPLILCEREDIERYCAANGITYVTDSTNYSTEYTRNRIRLALLPLLQEMNPSVVDAISRLSDCAAQDDTYLQARAEEAAAAFLSSGEMSALPLENDALMGRALVIICEKKCGISPEYRHVTAMERCFREGKGSVNLPEDMRFMLKNGIVVFEKIRKILPDTDELSTWRCEMAAGEIITPGGQKIILQVTDKNKYDNIRKIFENVFQNSLDYDKIKKASFRFRQNGDTFRPYGRGCRKSLKKLFNERRIPVEMRGVLPLIDCGGQIAWINGFGVAEGFEVTENTTSVLYIRTEENEPERFGDGGMCYEKCSECNE